MMMTSVKYGLCYLDNVYKKRKTIYAMEIDALKTCANSLANALTSGSNFTPRYSEIIVFGVDDGENYLKLNW